MNATSLLVFATRLDAKGKSSKHILPNGGAYGDESHGTQRKKHLQRIQVLCFGFLQIGMFSMVCFRKNLRCWRFFPPFPGRILGHVKWYHVVWRVGGWTCASQIGNHFPNTFGVKHSTKNPPPKWPPTITFPPKKATTPRTLKITPSKKSTSFILNPNGTNQPNIKIHKFFFKTQMVHTLHKHHIRHHILLVKRLKESVTLPQGQGQATCGSRRSRPGGLKKPGASVKMDRLSR